jgi:hypothetical protein
VTGHRLDIASVKCWSTSTQTTSSDKGSRGGEAELKRSAWPNRGQPDASPSKTFRQYGTDSHGSCMIRGDCARRFWLQSTEPEIC